VNRLKLCCIAPHAPILVPGVGGPRLAEVPGTASALSRLAREVEGIAPDTVAIISPPHVRLPSRDSFCLRTGRVLAGDLSRFGAPGAAVSMETDASLVAALTKRAAEDGVPLFEDETEREEDWGALVPLVLLSPRGAGLLALNACPGLGLKAHFELGACLGAAIEESGRDTVFIASGDMSHRLKPGAPSGYSPVAHRFDEQVVEIVRGGDLSGLFGIDRGLREEAGEDCLWPLAALAGALGGGEIDVEVMSYEGSFGVGYMVARLVPADAVVKRRPGGQ